MNSETYLYVAHPGHELALADWIGKRRPTINILTDGSGSENRERLTSSKSFIKSRNASRGSIFGRYTDKQIYARILDQSISEFHGLIEEIIEDWSVQPPDVVVVDELDGHNPAHDLMNLLVSIACQRYTSRSGRSPGLFSFYLSSPLSHTDIADTHRLDEASYQGKLRDIQAYGVKPRSVDLVTYRLGFDRFVDHIGEHFKDTRSALGPSEDPAHFHSDSAPVIDIYQSIRRRIVRDNIKIEIDLSTNACRKPRDWLRYEYLKPIEYDREQQLTRHDTTFYELYGEEKVKRGTYATVLRQRHLIDIWAKLKRDDHG